MHSKTLFASTMDIIQIDILGITFVVGGLDNPTYFRWPFEGSIELEDCGTIEYLPEDESLLMNSRPFPQRMLDSYPKIDKTTSLFTWRELIEDELSKWAHKNLESGFSGDNNALDNRAD